ncbi:MAG: ribosomal-protein-alanine acetyltransferase [Actinomycetota bacterium]|jgi:[ribosomal protein S18]-alanine N-acetyltransferase
MSVLSRFLRRSDIGAEISIDVLKRRDLAAIQAIEQVSYPKPWTPNVFLSEIEMMRRGERHYVVAHRGAELVGYAGLMFVVGDAHVTNIACAPSHHRSGVATRLLAELAWTAIARDCGALTLEVRVSNVGAQALYRSFGFAPVGVRQRYYENVEDAMVMWCHDIADEPYRERLRLLCPEAARV